MSLPNVPIVNAGLLYVNGMQLNNLVIPSSPVSSYVAGKAIIMQPGQARDSTDSNDIPLSQALDASGAPLFLNGIPVGCVINGLQVGANGVDQAVLVANSMYAVYAIASSTSVNSSASELGGGVSPNPLGPLPSPVEPNPYPPAGLLSLAANAAPFLPFGYDMYRRVGWVATGSTSLIVSFWQYDVNDQVRQYYWDAAVSVAAAATGAGLSPVALNTNLSPSATTAGVAVPPIASQVLLDVTLSGAGTARFAPFGSSSAAGVVRFSAGAAAEPGTVLAPEGLNAGVPTVLVGVSAGTAAISVVGFVDYL